MPSFRPSHWNISTKLFWTSLALLLVVGGLVTMNLLVFRSTEDTLLRLIDEDMAHVVRNAQIGRELSHIFTATNTLVYTFSEREETLQAEGNALIAALQRTVSLMGREGTALIWDSLQKFIRRLESLLEQCATLNASFGKLDTTETRLSETLDALEDLVVAKEIDLVLTGSSEETIAIQQLGALLSGYRELLFQIRLRSIESEQIHLSVGGGGKEYEARIVALIDEFQTGLEATTKTWDDIEPLLERLMMTLLEYREQIVRSHAEMREFQIRLGVLNETQEQVLRVMGEQEQNVSKSTKHFQEKVVANLRSSDKATLVLSGFILLLVLVTGAYTLKMIHPLKDLAAAADRLAQGNISVEILKIDSHDEIGMLSQAFERMTANLQRTMAEMKLRDWLKTGQAELNTLARGEQTVEQLAQRITAQLAEYVSAHVGAMYVKGSDGSFELLGSYAFPRSAGSRPAIVPGEDLVGQAILEKRPIAVADIPAGYLSIRSGLGETQPQHLTIVPFVYDGDVKGAIELGTIDRFTAEQQEFLELSAESIGIALHTARNRETIDELLEETQRQSEELQQQQESLQQQNEELQAQSEILRESEEQLKTEQENLQETNQKLEEHSHTLQQKQQELGLRNTELERARQLLEDKALDLERANTYKSEFLANMSHELRTPLNSLLILSKMLSNNPEGNLTEKQVEFADTMHEAGTELLELINEILDLSRIEAGRLTLHLEDLELHTLSEYIERNFRHIAQERALSLDISLDETLPASIRTDVQRVEQIVKNFLSNAFKFTEQGGIHVRIARPADECDLSGSGLDRRETLVISVSDTGIGIPPEKLDVIFRAFQQADGSTTRRYGGSGLGLSIAQELAALLGGEVQVQSEEGRGSAFSLYLPENFTPQEPSPVPSEILAGEERESPVSPAAASSLPEAAVLPDRPETVSIDEIPDDRRHISRTDRTVLIIEDDPKFVKILREHAHQQGFQCLIAGDGEAGLQLAFQHQPDAIVLDIGLPGMDGWAVMDRLKKNRETQHIPVHFISALDKRLEALQMGAIGYLTKPVELEELESAFTTIEDAIARSIKHVLIVENNAGLRASIADLLRSSRIVIRATDSGEEAYELLQRERIDCMVLDLGLADISGADLLERIKNEQSLEGLPVIVYTGKELTNEERQLLERYSESIIIKGVKSEERLLDEVTLFLHHVESRLPESQHKKRHMLRDREEVFKDKRILVVDDDVRNVFALTSMLEEKGIEVLMGVNGKEALALLDEEPGIDLVLMDMMMPEMDGYDATRAIRSRPEFRELPVIALTAKAMKGDRQKCIDAGANDYVSKPIHMDKLLSLLRVWLY